MKLRIVKREMTTVPGVIGYYVEHQEGDKWRFEMFYPHEEDARRYVERRIVQLSQPKVEPEVIAEFGT